VTVADGHGGTATQTVTITLVGFNDPPVIAGGTTTGTVMELPGVTGSSATDTATGTLSFGDVDLTDMHTVSVQPHGSNGASYVGTLVPVIAADSTGTGVGSLTWTYQAVDSALDLLAAG
jgi:hypothetical protein